MSPEQMTYYRERARQERARAQEAARADIAEIHYELARLYDGLISMSEQAPNLRLVG